ncbi:MAG: tetratricopeptide repeat protein [Candidatus Aminicenantes bacterium]|nr:MAG: tetratricopeptide repeat protein [Candidatus Aminicenantes bacterium]
MTIIYKITITPAEKEKTFRITWFNPDDGTEDSFNQSLRGINPGEMAAHWSHFNYQISIGEKIFHFLDGDSRHLSRALDQSRQQGQPLHLQLCTCNEVADWPFELLANAGSFLLPQQVHLARCESNWGEKRNITPQDRPLKLLFMACSPVDVEPELDFEKEEETIFKITDKLPLHMEVEDSGSLEGLCTRIMQESYDAYDVIHISGHADIDENGKPYFMMEDETGHGEMVSPEMLWHEALSSYPPNLLFLSGCRTGQAVDTKAAVSFARQLIEKYHVPAVLGWGRPVDDEQATFMEKIIYHNLSGGKTIFEALQDARSKAMRKYPDSKNPPWPLLRLFCCGKPPGALVKEKIYFKPAQRRMKHVYLKDSQVRILEEGFVGRRRELQENLNTLKNELDKVGVLLLGMGGLGKSCLAGKICERFPQHTLIIVHGKFNAISLQEALNDAFINNNDQKGKDILSEKKEMTDKLSNLCVNSFKMNNYLILLDDFEQNLEGAEKGQPGNLLPEAVPLLQILLYYLLRSEKSTGLIITSRYSFSLTVKGRDLVKDRLEWISLSGLLEAEQKKKVQALPNIYSYSNQGLIPKQVMVGHGNPRLMEWLDVLIGHMKNVDLRQLEDAIADKKEEFICTHVIRELLNWGGQHMARLLQWCSIYRRPVLKEGIKEMGEKTGVKHWEELANQAIGFTLLEYNQTRESYLVSPLLREELQAGIDDIKSCHQTAFDYYKRLCERMKTIDNTFDPLEVEEWIFHALACGEEEVASRQGGILVDYFRNYFAFREARRLGEWILGEKKRELNTADDSFLLNALGYSINELGDPQKAIEYYNKALIIDRALYGENHSQVAVVLNNLGAAFEEMGNYRLAIRYYRESMNIDQEVYGEEHANAALRLINIGSALYKSGKVDRAITCFDKALKILKKTREEGSTHVASVLNNLGAAWKAKDQLKKAIDYYNQALEINCKVYGKEHPIVAANLNNLGMAWKSAGEIDKAINYYEQAVSIWEKVYGENSPYVSVAYNNLGSAYKALGQTKMAEEYFEKAHIIIENNPDIIGRLVKNLL